jgi:hypothetical protein
VWRGGLGRVYRFPALSYAGASLTRPCFVSTLRSSNWMCGFPASSSRRKGHEVAHGKLRVRLVRQTRPSMVVRESFGNRLVPGQSSLCLAHNH